MRILFVLEHYHPYIGGAENLFTKLTRRLAKNGAQVTVVTTRYNRALAAKEILEGVHIIRVPCYNRYLFTLLSLPRIFSASRFCDLIHTTTYNAAFPAWLAGKILRKPVVVTFHEVWGKLWWQLPFISKWQKWGYYLYEQLILKLPFNQYIAVSNYTKSCLKQAGIRPDRIRVIYNGLDKATFQAYQHQSPPNFTYTFFGRLGISKGLDMLLPTAQQFYAQYPESRLQLIIPQYPKPMFRKIQKIIRQLQLGDHIIMLHDLPKRALYQALCRSSCVVIPSYSEGFCFAAAEAVALNVPVITSQKGALKEVVSGRFLEIDPFTVNGLLNALYKAAKGQWQEVPWRFFPIDDTIKKHVTLYGYLLDN